MYSRIGSALKYRLERVKTLKWAHSLRSQRVVMEFNRVPPWHNIDEKPTIILYSYILSFKYLYHNRGTINSAH